MKIIGQNSDGRIVIDGEGEEVTIDKGIPADSPMFVTNFVFNIAQTEEDKEKVIDNRVIADKSSRIFSKQHGMNLLDVEMKLGLGESILNKQLKGMVVQEVQKNND